MWRSWDSRIFNRRVSFGSALPSSSKNSVTGSGSPALCCTCSTSRRGEHETSFYAICTGFMALGLILPGSLAGYPLQWLGYTGFFIWILIATIPSFLVTWIVVRQLDPGFGRREATT